MRRVVVTGVGAVTPLGATAQATWQRLLRGCSGVAELQRRSSDYEPHGISVGVAAEIKQAGHPQLAQLPPAERALLEYVPAPQTRKLGSSSGLPSNLSFALDSAAQALAAANGGVAGPGTSGSAVQRSLVEHHGCERVGVAVGAGISGLQDILANQAAMLDKGARRVSPYLVPYSLVNMAAGMISIAHGLQGPNHAVSTACATGAHAIGDAFRFIKHGDADAMVCGGTDACIVPVVVAGFHRAKALVGGPVEAAETLSRPFDKGRSGFVIGEGAGILVLEEREAALARKAPILAELVGYGLSGDAHHITAPEENGSGAQRCMRAALREAQISPQDVDYINAHATSTPVGDVIEARAIGGVFGNQVAVSSSKGALGHLLGAAGAVEAIITIMSLREQIAPHTLNLSQPADGIDLNLITQGPKSLTMRYALSNSFGFGGTNASLCFARGDR